MRLVKMFCDRCKKETEDYDLALDHIDKELYDLCTPCHDEFMMNLEMLTDKKVENGWIPSDRQKFDEFTHGFRLGEGLR